MKRQAIATFHKGILITLNAITVGDSRFTDEITVRELYSISLIDDE